MIKGKIARAVFCAVSLAMSAGAANAQSTGQSLDWSGPYAGATFGYTIVDIDGDLTFPPGAGATIPYDTVIKTLTIAGHAGYGFQFGDVVLGGEIDLAYPFDGNVAAFPGRIPEFDLGWHGHVRGRAGYLLQPDLLIYGALGLAIADVEARRVPAALAPTSASSDILYGLSAGVGAEFIPVEDIRIRVEYVYDNYFDQGFAGAGTFGGILFPALDAQLQSHTVRVGMTFYFN